MVDVDGGRWQMMVVDVDCGQWRTVEDSGGYLHLTIVCITRFSEDGRRVEAKLINSEFCVNLVASLPMFEL